MNSGRQAVGTPSAFAYHVLSAALDRYGKSPAELDAGEREVVETQAHKAHTLESRILASAEARDVLIPPTRVETSLNTVKDRYPDLDAFYDELERNQMTEPALREALRRELVVETVLDRVGARAAKVSEVDAMIYYYIHLERFEQPETRSVRHILVTVNEDFAENRRDAVRERIGQIRERVVRKPHRFADQAVKHSECPTALQGGQLGRLPRGQLFPELDAVLFTLAEEEISEPVESPLGFHVLYCERIHPSGPVAFAEARDRILSLLRERRQRMCKRAWLSALAPSEAEVAEGRHA
jgi:peptidyl-prolyl cis-trans isomerase C